MKLDVLQANGFSEEKVKLAAASEAHNAPARLPAAESDGTSIARQGLTDPKCVPADPQLPFLAPEILAHLAKQRGAQDTIDGIQWGVLHACTVNWVSKIAMTVAQLVEQGFLEEKRSSDKIFYHISPSYLSNLQQPPPKNSTPDATQ